MLRLLVLVFVDPLPVVLVVVTPLVVAHVVISLFYFLLIILLLSLLLFSMFFFALLLFLVVIVPHVIVLVALLRHLLILALVQCTCECMIEKHIIFFNNRAIVLNNLIWVKFSTWRASIALDWLSLYSNSYFVLFVCNVCMTSIYSHFI